MASSIKRDDHKQQWEETEFPLVCETCLGDNPYIRMTKEPHGKACMICETPFTVFSWQAGTKGRLKRVEICQNCARTKNVCQVCIFDLQYGLPVQLRDTILAEHGSSHAVAAIPQSDANRSWYKQQQARAIEQGTAGVVPGEAAHSKLQSIARILPRYERNLPKLCSFFSRGECNRGSNCPFRHEMPKDRNDPLSKQNTKDRFYGTNDPVANKMEASMKAKERKHAAEQSEHDPSSATLYIGFNNRNGTPEQLEHLPTLTEVNIRDRFYSYGEIISVKILKENKGALVEYTSRAATELAINAMNNKEICGRKMFVDFSRAPKRGDANDVLLLRDAQPADASINSGPVDLKPIAPPGFKGGSAPAPKGFEPVRPPVTAAPAPSRISGSIGVPRPGVVTSAVPRPGGGAIRKLGVGLGSAASNPYPSQDPSRLGSHAKS